MKSDNVGRLSITSLLFFLHQAHSELKGKALLLQLILEEVFMDNAK